MVNGMMNAVFRVQERRRQRGEGAAGKHLMTMGELWVIG